MSAMTSAKGQEYFSPRHISEMFGWSKKKTYDLIGDGTLLAYKIGGSLRIPRSAITDMLGEPYNQGIVEVNK